VSFNFAPKGFATCNGQLLPINQNQALFSLLGTTYGGNGTTTFALPNLQGRVPVHAGNNLTLGESAGEESHTLVLAEIPVHQHSVTVENATATASDPTGNFLANGGVSNFIDPGSATGALNPSAVGSTGGGQPHENRSPFLTLNFVIALQGIFPSRS
jgi:microcystin-dependent protein